MKKPLKSILTELRSVADETEKVLDRLSLTSDRLSAKSSSALFGTLGGLGGLSAAYLICAISTASLPVTGVLLASLGIAVGVAAYRGPRWFSLERRIGENRVAVNEILDRIKKLPKNAPKEVRDDLWDTYRSLTGGLQRQTSQVLTGGIDADEQPPQKFLPPATQFADAKNQDI